MNTSRNELAKPLAVDVQVSQDAVTVRLADGRSIAAPVAWYPRLAHATREERRRWQLIGSGTGIHWPDIDEDISVEALLAGFRSSESRASLDKWLAARRKGADAH